MRNIYCFYRRCLIINVMIYGFNFFNLGFGLLFGGGGYRVNNFYFFKFLVGEFGKGYSCNKYFLCI